MNALTATLIATPLVLAGLVLAYRALRDVRMDRRNRRAMAAREAYEAERRHEERAARMAAHYAYVEEAHRMPRANMVVIPEANMVPLD